MTALDNGEMRIVACTAPFLGVEKCEESKLTNQKTAFYLGFSPCPVTVATRTIMFLVGDPNKPSFATVTGRGDDPNFTTKITKPGPSSDLRISVDSIGWGILHLNPGGTYPIPESPLQLLQPSLSEQCGSP